MLNRLMNSIDKTTNKHHGENIHMEYSWSNDMNECFVQFYFQLVRIHKDKSLDILETMLEKMIQSFRQQHPIYRQFMNNTDYLFDLYKLIFHTRDIIHGKGECRLAYMQIFVWYKYYPELAIEAFRKFVIGDKYHKHPYGSWKDLKYLCEYVKNHKDGGKEHPLIKDCISILVSQLKQDKQAYEYIQTLNETKDLATNSNSSIQSIQNIPIPKIMNISLAGKWCPREKGRFAWLYKSIVKQWVPEYFESVGDLVHQYERAMKKGCREFRRFLSSLNQYLDTTQVKMCGKQWSNIDFNNVTSLTIHKNKNAFLNITGKLKYSKVENNRYPNDQDRITCSTNFKNHIQVIKSQIKSQINDNSNNDNNGGGGSGENDNVIDDNTANNTNNTNNDNRNTIKEKILNLNSKRLTIYEMVKQALELKLNIKYDKNMNANIRNLIDLLNLQWDIYKNKNHEQYLTKHNKSRRGFGNMIPMVDTSGSMCADKGIPLYSAIGLGILIAELANESFKDRIMTFSSTPEWVNLENKETFVEKVNTLSEARWGMNTNFYSALSMILDVIIKNNIPPEVVSNMVLVVLSDMQIDNSSHENMETLYDTIKMKYSNAGLQSTYKTPYEPPHILFWNLRSTNGFPVLSTQKNVTMLSGFNSQLLNSFCDKGYDSLLDYTPYKLIHELLDKPYYNNTDTKNTFYKYIDTKMDTK